MLSAPDFIIGGEERKLLQEVVPGTYYCISINHSSQQQSYTPENLNYTYTSCTKEYTFLQRFSEIDLIYKMQRQPNPDAMLTINNGESENFTIGTEQVIVSLALLLISLILLSRNKNSDALAFIKDFMKYKNPFRRGSVSRPKNTSINSHSSPTSSGIRIMQGSGVGTYRSRLRRWYKSKSGLSISSPMRKSKSTPLVQRKYSGSPSSPSMCTGVLGDASIDPTDILLDQGDENVDYNQSNINNPINQTEREEDTSDQAEFYSDHERFTSAYNSTVRNSEYRRLVLPPECKLLDPSKIPQSRQADEHTASMSFVDIWIKIIEWMHNIISFDYIGYTVHFNYRILKAVAERARKWKWLGMPMPPQDDDEEEDDNTVASAGSRRSLLSREGSVSVGGSVINSYTVPTSAATSAIPSGPFHLNNTDGTNKNAKTGFVSALSTPIQIQRKTLTDPFDALDSAMVSSITTTEPPSTESSIPIADTLSQDGSIGSHSLASISIKQRERFYTGDDHRLDPKDYGYYEKSPGRNRSPLHKRPMSAIHDTSFDHSMHSIDGMSVEYNIDENAWVAEGADHQNNDSERTNYMSNMSPMRIISDEKKDHSQSSFDDALTSDSSFLDMSTAGFHAQPRSHIISSQETSQAQSPSPQLNHTSKSKLSVDSLSMPLLPPKPTGKAKRRDTLEKYRNASNKSVIHAKPTSSQNGDVTTSKLPAKMKISVRSQSHELSYFDTATNDASIRQLERAAPLPDREGYILGDQFLEDPKRDTPLLVFVNTRSGSQQGPILKMQLRSLLNPIQVWDLADGGPEKILRSFSVLTRLRLLVCGGDGTVSWIISALDQMNLERWPPIAILPLGTGNDLARIHGWGAGYANESLLVILDQVKESYISLLDRWTITIDEKRKKKSKRKKPTSKPFINYMSVGMDAESALQVHNLRENSPWMFFSRAVNKVWYAIFGAEEAIKASYSDLPQQIILEADGVEVPIPKDSQGLIFLNIDSYLGGVPLWSRGVPVRKKIRTHERRYSEGDFYSISDEITRGRKRGMSFFESDSVIGDSSIAGEDENDETKEERLNRIMACTTPSSCQDGKVDIISHKGNFNLGQIRVGLTNTQRLCQCSKVKITLKKGFALQVDGEPWKQNSSVLRIERNKDPAVMLHRAIEEGGGIETEVANLLEWAEEKNIIHRDTHATLMKEFSRRVEKKTRARRNKSTQNVFVTMKRRIASSHRFPTVSD